MRKILIYLLVAIAAVALLAACQSQPEAEEAAVDAPAAADTSEEAMP